MLKVGIISTILGHGKILQDSGTALILLFFALPNIEEIEVFTWEKDSEESIGLPEKVRVYPVYSPKKTFSAFEILRECLKSRSDKLIFNMMPTALGNSSISNFIGLISPIILKRVFHRDVTVVYHNSIFTNDFVKLGYTGFLNVIRAKFLKIIEIKLFTSVDVLMLSRIYSERIGQLVKDSRVEYLDLKFFQVLGTLQLNGKLSDEVLKVKANIIPRILLFGSWGPQKDPSPVFKILRALRRSGIDFFLTVAGGVNQHFPEFKEYIDDAFTEYDDTIDRRIGYVAERELLDLFLETDLLLINYNAPGGFSSVMSFGIFFNTYIIASDFEEFREQASTYERIKLCHIAAFEQEIRMFIQEIHPKIAIRTIEIGTRVREMENTLSNILNRK